MTELGHRLDRDPRGWRTERILGGSINRACSVVADDTQWFVKINTADREAKGLQELAHALRVPQVIATGSAGDFAFLALEWLDFESANAEADTLLGRQLAAQHRVTAESFGWERDNTIGTTPQINETAHDWAEFFRDRRLKLQLELAMRNGLPREASADLRDLLVMVPSLLSGHSPEPSLLHGDLWSGNRGALHDGTPVVFDPAVYYGDRETDLAMTRLFGGFGPAFYAAYTAEFPLSPGWERRSALYNLLPRTQSLQSVRNGISRQRSICVCASVAGYMTGASRDASILSMTRCSNSCRSSR